MIIKQDQDTIKSYFEDSSNLKGGYAEKVVIPQTIEELSGILEESNSKKVPVNIAGGGTGTTGSRIPFGGIVLSMERFNKIISISEEDKSSTVEAGVLVEDFKNACERNGLFYACHPTEKTAFMGGTVATNASGARSFKYGPTRKYIKGLVMVLANGSVLDIRRGEKFLTRNDPVIELGDGQRIKIPLPAYKMPAVKNSAGYFVRDEMDLIDLFIGQEGTLSVIARIEMALLAKPSDIFGCFVFFRKEEDAWGFAGEAKRGLDALSLEYLDSNALRLLRIKNKNVPGDSKAAIFFEKETGEEKGEALAGELQKLIARHNASLDDTWAAMTENDLEEFTEFRHSIPESINDIVRRSSYQKLSTDIAVPDTRFLEMMDFYKERFKKTKIEHVIFGHIGESHVHVNLLPNSEKEAREAKEACMAFVRKGVSLGGTVSAEHGIGKTRHEYLEVMYGRRGILEMARLKKALDPNLILGLRNIFPLEVLNRV